AEPRRGQEADAAARAVADGVARPQRQRALRRRARRATRTRCDAARRDVDEGAHRCRFRGQRHEHRAASGVARPSAARAPRPSTRDACFDPMRYFLLVALATVGVGCTTVNRGAGMNPATAATDAKADVAQTGASTDSIATNGSDTTSAPTRL